MGNAWSFGSLVRGLNPRVQSWAEIPPCARPHKAEGLGKFVFWELFAPTKAKRESKVGEIIWRHINRQIILSNIDGLRKAGDAPRHTIVDYIHIIFAHSTIPVCCMFLCVTVLNPKLLLPLCEGLWPVDRMSNRRKGGRWPNVSMDVRPGCPPFVIRFQGLPRGFAPQRLLGCLI